MKTNPLDDDLIHSLKNMYEKSIVFPTANALNQMIDRSSIRFDQEMVCCESLVRENLYMCLECGKIYSGGSPNTPLFMHFAREGHTVAICIKTNRFIVLPAMIEIPSYPELYDIQFSARPQYTEDVIQKILQKQKEGIMINNKKIYPGQISFDLRAQQTSQLSVIRFLSRLTSLRNYLLLNPQQTPIASELSRFFKQLFNPYGFKDVISPFNLLRALQTISNDKYSVENPVNPAEYFQFILQTLNKEIPAKIVSKMICGKLDITDDDNKTQVVNFWKIPLEPYECPVYRNGLEKEKIIPQVTLEFLLERYNGTQVTSTPQGNLKVLNRKMKFKSASDFLWIDVNRIRPASFGLEKLNLHIVHSDDGSINLSKYGVNAIYDIVSIIAHEGDVNSGIYVTYSKNEAGVWLKCLNTEVTESMLQVALTSQCCHLLYQKR